MPFLNDDFICSGDKIKAIQSYLNLYDKVIAPKPNNWLCHPGQQEKQSGVCDSL